MTKTVRVCDICNREIDDCFKFYRFKVQSLTFVTYANCNDWRPDIKKFDICEDCMAEIALRIKSKEKLNDD